MDSCPRTLHSLEISQIIPFGEGARRAEGAAPAIPAASHCKFMLGKHHKTIINPVLRDRESAACAGSQTSPRFYMHEFQLFFVLNRLIVPDIFPLKKTDPKKDNSSDCK
jgi:hypothetical protein